MDACGTATCRVKWETVIEVVFFFLRSGVQGYCVGNFGNNQEFLFETFHHS